MPWDFAKFFKLSSFSEYISNNSSSNFSNSSLTVFGISDLPLFLLRKEISSPSRKLQSKISHFRHIDSNLKICSLKHVAAFLPFSSLF